MNNFFTLLSREVDSADGRHIELGTYKQVPKVEELHSVLIPQRDDKYIAMCTEQLLQCVLQSDYKDRLMELDTVNTYNYPILTLSDDSYEIINSQDIEVVVLNENTEDPRWSERSFTVTIDPTALEATVAGLGIPTTTYSFTMTNNLSSKILLADKIYLRLKGTLPASEFVVSVRYSQKFTRNINNIIETVSNLEIPWYNIQYTDAYMASTSDLSSIAILTMNLYEILKDGSS